MRINKNEIIAFSLLMINPILAITFSLFNMRGRETYLKYILSFAMALFAYRFVPFIGMDLSRYYDIYHNVKDIDFADINKYYQYNLAIIFFIKGLTLLGLNKEFLPFISVFISYLFTFSAISMVYTKLDNDKKYRYLFICSFFTIQILASLSGLRNGIATSIFLYACVSFFYGNKKTSYILMALSCFIHSYIMLPVVFILFNEYIFKYVKFNTLKFLLIFSFFISYSGVSFYIVNYVVGMFPSEISLYIKSNFIENKIMGFAVEKTLIQSIINNLILSSQYYVMVILMIFVKKSNVNNLNLNSYMFLICITVTMLYGFDIIQLRYMYLFNLLSIIYFLNLKNEPHGFFLFFLFFGLLSFSWSLFFIKLSIIKALSFIYLPTVFNFYFTVNMNDLIKIW